MSDLSLHKNTNVRKQSAVPSPPVPSPSVRATFVGTATVLLEVGGLRILTDPVLERAGQRYRVGKTDLATYTHLQDPALRPEEIGPIDLALVSHDHHKDNLDRAGRKFLETVPTTLTTQAGARRLTERHGVRALGLDPWQTHEVITPEGANLRITATPAQHSPRWLHPIVGDVVGFLLDFPSWGGKSLWISGDTRWFPGLDDLGRRAQIGLALIHVGAGGFGITGPIRYSFDGRDLVKVTRQLAPDLAVPIHFEGWSHFREGRDDLERIVARADRRRRPKQLAVGERLRWLEPGVPQDLPISNTPRLEEVAS